MNSRGWDNSSYGTRLGQRGAGAQGSSWPGGFSPASLPGLVAWYDASLGITFGSGSRVSAWGDQSGNGNHLLQASASVQPVYNTGGGGPNGGPYLSSSGTRFMQAAFTLAQPYEIFTIVSSTWTTNGTAQCIFDGNTLNTGKIEYNQTGNNNVGQYSGLNANVTLIAGSVPVPASAWRIFDCQFNGVNSQFTLSGIQSSVGNCGTNVPNGVTVMIEGNGSSNGLTGGMAAMYIYNQIQSSANRALLLSYMQGKGGL